MFNKISINKNRSLANYPTSLYIFSFKLSHEVVTGSGTSGEGRRPWAITISTSMPHISFFFSGSRATTISPSRPPHLTLPGKTTLLNGIFRAFKVWLSIIQPFHAKTFIYIFIYLSVNIKRMIPLNVNYITFFANLNSNYHKKWLIFKSNMNIKMTHHKINFSFEGSLVWKCLMCLRENC